MFWGLVLEPGKRYSTTVEKSFHVSKAALDCSSVRNDNEILSVMLETEGSEALLCNLCKNKGILQENLDLNFMTGDRLTFECRGHGRIHLSGYLLPDDDDDMSGMLGDEESEEEEEEAEWPASSSPEKPKKDKRKQDAPPDVSAKKKKPLPKNEEENEGDSDSEQDDESDLSEGLEDEDVDEDDDEDDDDEEGDDDDESEDEDDNVVLSPKEKQKQQNQDKKKTPNKQQNATTPKKTPITNGLTPKEQSKSNQKTSGEKTPNANATPKQKHVLDHGVVVKELRIGSGAPAKIGRTVVVHYIGKLKDGNKIFDKQLKGEGFRFKMGKGEVIKGWDIGLQGMKVGGKRVIHCPPEVAYGVKGVPPKIPPNSTLIFEVELKNVH